MRCINLVRTLICFFIFASTGFAAPDAESINLAKQNIASRFEQGFKVGNLSSQAILVKDLSRQQFEKDDPISPNDGITTTIDSPQFTLPSKQRFDRTLKIVSAIDNKLICLITNRLSINETFIQQVPTSDSAACETRSYFATDPKNGAPIYGFVVVVH